MRSFGLSFGSLGEFLERPRAAPELNPEAETATLETISANSLNQNI